MVQMASWREHRLAKRMEPMIHLSLASNTPKLLSHHSPHKYIDLHDLEKVNSKGTLMVLVTWWALQREVRTQMVSHLGMQ